MSREAAKQQACRADVLNTLPSLTESLAEFTAKDDVNVINAVIRDLFIQHGLERTLAILLLHRHSTIEQNGRLVVLNGVSSPSSYDQEITAGSHVIPRSWRINTDGSLQSIEFRYLAPSVGLGSGAQIETEISQDFTSDLAGILSQYNLQDALGIILIGDLGEHEAKNGTSAIVLEVANGQSTIMLPVAQLEGFLAQKTLTPVSWNLQPQLDSHAREGCIAVPWVFCLSLANTTTQTSQKTHIIRSRKIWIPDSDAEIAAKVRTQFNVNDSEYPRCVDYRQDLTQHGLWRGLCKSVESTTTQWNSRTQMPWTSTAD